MKRLRVLVPVLAVCAAAFAISISSEMAVDAPIVSAAPLDQVTPAAAFDGTNFLVVWADVQSSSWNNIVGTRMTPSGAVLDSGLLQIAGANGKRTTSPAVAFDGTNYLVVWAEDSGSGTTSYIRGARVSPAGDVLDPYGFNIVTGTTNVVYSSPAIDFDGTNYFVAWQYTLNTQNRIDGAFVTPGGAVPLTIAGLSQGTTDARTPAVAFDGTNHLLVWDDGRNDFGTGNREIFGTRLTPSGGVLDPNGHALVVANGAQRNPAVAFGSTGYLLAYEDAPAGGVTTLAVSTSLAVSGSLLAGGSLASLPSIAFDGTNFLVAFWRSNGASDIYARRVAQDGSSPDAAELPVLVSGTAVSSPVAAFGGGTFLVAWDEVRTGATRDIYGARVTSAGAVSDPGGVLLSRSANQESVPSVAFDGTNYLVVWADTRNGTSDIYGLRYSANGTPVDSAPFPIVAEPTKDQTSPVVAFDGTNYLVGYVELGFNDSDVYGVVVSPNGVVSAPFAISTAQSYQGVPAIAAASNGGGFLVAWKSSQTPQGLYAGRVSSSGTVLDPNGTLIASGSGTNPSVASDGTDYVVAFEAQAPGAGGATDIYAVRFTSAGALLDATPLTVTTMSNSDYRVDIAYGGGEYMLVWTGYTGGSGNAYDLYAEQMFRDGGFGNRSNVSFNAPWTQAYADLAFDGTNFVAVWLDERNLTDPTKLSLQEIYAARIRPDSSGIDQPNVNLTQTPTWNEGSPHLARGVGKKFLLAYSKTRSPYYTGAVRTFVRTAVFNDAPVVANASYSLNRNTPQPITLSVTDKDGDALTYSIVSPPANGTLSGTGTQLTYTPNSGYVGQDSFTFKANDGTADSNIGTVSLTIIRPNNAPVASSGSVTTAEDTAAPVTLAASDADSDPLTYTIVNGPTKGTLTGTAPSNLTYTPSLNATGSDSFTFKVNDGYADSNTATVSITITPVNDPPVAQSQSVTTAEDTAVTITLVATDPDNSNLTYAATGAQHGSISGNGSATITYTPAANYNGTDTLTFTASDGTNTSSPATVTITITPVNDAPVANAGSVTVAQGGTASITLTGTDADNDPLTYSVLTQPANGTLSGSAPNLTFTPASGFRGQTSFNFQVDDGTAQSASAAVTITVSNAAPVVSLAIEPPNPTEGAQVLLTGTATDPGGDALTYLWNFGDGSPTATTLTATHAFAAAGTYTVVFSASDGVDTTSAQQSVTVAAVVGDAGSGGGAGGGSGGGVGGGSGGGSGGGAGGGGSDAKASGCGCSSADGAAMWALFGVVAILRRRRGA